MTKMEKLLELYQIQLQELMVDPDTYRQFTLFAASMYKYPFAESLLVFAQRPSATLCGEFEFWTAQLGLSLVGAKGIPIIRSYYGQNRITYLFDIADVSAPPGKRLPTAWSAATLLNETVHPQLLGNNSDLQQRIGQYIAQNSQTLLTDLSDGWHTPEKILSDLSATGLSILLKRAGSSTIVEPILPAIYEPVSFAFAHNLILAAVRTEFAAYKKRVIEWRKHHEQSQTTANTGVADTYKHNQPRAEPGTHRSTPGTLRHSVDEVHGDQPSAGGNADAGQRQLLPDSTSQGAEVKRNVPAAGGDAASGISRPKRKRVHVPSGTGEPVEGNRNRDGDGEPFEQLQLTLFSAASIVPDITSVVPAPPVKINQEKALPPVLPVCNFRIEESSTLFPGGLKQKYSRNIDAIQLLYRIEQNGKAATPEEQQILTQYSGWGGLPQVFDAQNERWVSECQQLQELLSPEEYELARGSTLNAHYTSPKVIASIYQALHNWGFKQGKILEPALGVGYFFGLLPDELQGCELHGIELDSITGRIAKQLYPSAKIKIKGFQDVPYPDGYFDAMVGNVPFGDYNISDNRYKMHIHDYFFVRGLDKLRPGGIMAFVTSKGTLDKKSNQVRRMIAQRADLLGAIRLPQTAFKEIAGTEVTTDIIFLQRRESPPEEYPDWVFTEELPDAPSIRVNSYFVQHPEMMLGTMVARSGMYGGNDTALQPLPDWEEKLGAAIDQIEAIYRPPAHPSNKLAVNTVCDLPLEENVPKFTYCFVEGQLYYNDGIMLRYQSLDRTKTVRILGMDSIRQAVRSLIAIQRQERYTDSAFDQLQHNLNRLYDKFVDTHGYLNDRANQLAFSDDVDIALLSSLEEPNEDGSYRKAAFFSKATIRPTTTISHADTPTDALLISLNQYGTVDMDYMATLTGLTPSYLFEQLEGKLFRDHCSTQERPCYVTAEEYLSGDVRAKLVEVQALVEEFPDLQTNLAALEQVQPEWIPAVDIGVRMSSTWIPESYINEFIHQLLRTPGYLTLENSMRAIHAHYTPYRREWTISNKSSHTSVVVTAQYGTTRIGAYHIIESILNQREITIRDAEDNNGKTVYKYNHDETVAAREKQALIEQQFSDWIFADYEWRNRLEHIYNHTFNRTRPRIYDGSYITLPHANPYITLRPHQLNAVAFVRTGLNTLLAHAVGAGKTYTMIAGGMELLRLGIRRKLLYAVPNHMTNDFARDFLKLYPNAQLLVPTERDFSKNNRQRFIAKVTTGDIQVIVIGHSQFDKLDISPDRKAAELQAEMDALEHVLCSANVDNMPRYTIKQIEKSKKALAEKIKELMSGKNKDTMLTFEDLGIDHLFLDEAQAYKNGELYSKMSNIAGIPSNGSQRATDLLSKMRYLNSIGGGFVYATGTVLSNTVCEMFVFQRYLQENSLHARGIFHFDEWAANFGQTVISIEAKPEGGGFRTNTRFAEFYNLPELMTLFCEVADIQTADMLNLPRPKLRGGKATIVACEPSPELKEFMASCVGRAQRIRSGLVDSSEDNMLKLTSEARKAGTDIRLLDSSAPFDPMGKLAQCATQICLDLEESTSFKGTVLVFCDIGTPNPAKFNVYDELRRLLELQGVPADTIAYIHEAKTAQARQKLFDDMRTGAKRVLIGSTQKCGAGTNIQQRLVSLHHIDCPWRPSDIEQREGRILRQGNQNDEVAIYRYVTKGSFDSYLWQLVEQKQRFISQIMSGKPVGRTCKDIDETILSFAEVKAIACGDPRIRESMELQMDIDKLQVLKRQHQREQHRLQEQYAKYPERMKALQNSLDKVSTDILATADYPTDFQMILNGITYTERTKAAEALAGLMATAKTVENETAIIGAYKGLYISLASGLGRSFRIQGAFSYQVEMGDDPLGNIRRLENKVESLLEIRGYYQEQIVSLSADMETTNAQLALPFAFEQVLSEKQERFVALTATINAENGLVAETTSSYECVER